MPRACSPTSATGCSSSTPRVSCDSGTRRPRQSLGFPAPTSSGWRAYDAIPGWGVLEPSVPVARSPHPGGRAATLRLELPERELWLSISGVGFDEGIVYAFRDLTDERALEKMKTDFVSTISHELRTPLAAIYGSGLTLKRDDVSLTEERRTALLGVIVDEADRLARIVNDVLWASRLDSGPSPSRSTSATPPRSCATSSSFTGSIRPARSSSCSRPSRARVRRRGPPPAGAQQPRRERRQVLPDGGRVEVTLQRAGDRIRFRISDEGIGIPLAERERIFEKFYRLDPELTRGVGGTGLGLYICRELVRRMDGRIWVEAPNGRGSSFVIELPAAAPSEEARTWTRAPRGSRAS